MAFERVRRTTGLSPWAIVGVAALGVPRAIAHDVGHADSGTNAVLVVAPVLIWIVVVLWRRVPNPFVTLLAVGLAYGVLLGVTHQVLWAEAFGEDPPSLGANLAGDLPPSVEQAVLRGFAVLSSLVTGTLVGALAGAAGWAAARLVRRRSGRCAG